MELNTASAEKLVALIYPCPTLQQHSNFCCSHARSFPGLAFTDTAHHFTFRGHACSCMANRNFFSLIVLAFGVLFKPPPALKKEKEFGYCNYA